MTGLLLQDVSAAPRLHDSGTVVTPYNPETVSRQVPTGRLSARTARQGEILDISPARFKAPLSAKHNMSSLSEPAKIRFNSRSDDNVSFWGNVLYAESWESSGEYKEGIYSFPGQKNTTLTPLCVDGELYANGGGVFDGNLFKFISYVSYSDGSIYSVTYNEYDVHTWTKTKSQQLEASQYGVIANIIAHDPVSDRYYGIFPREASAGTDFGYVDYTTMTKTVIAPAENVYLAMAINSLGEVYAIGQYGDLFKIDKSTGSEEYIGETGVYPAAYLQSMTFDLDTNRLYWAAMLLNGKSWLCEIDTEYGEISKISDFSDGEEIVCLYVPRKIADEGAPAKVQDLHVLTDKASSMVSIDFVMPELTYGGSALTDDLQYEVSVNTDVVSVGNAAPGEKVVLGIDAPYGEVKFNVVAVNAVGKGEPESYRTWVGYDVPLPVTGLTFKIDESTGMSVVSWTASAGGVHDAYVEKITYDVTRYPDGEVVATGLTATEWSEPKPVGNIQEYSYEVVAVNGDRKSAPARSNSIVTGDSYGMPYFCGFDSEVSFDEYMVLDMNEDGRTWTYNDGYQAISYTYSSENAADDWALTPELKFKSSVLYNVSIKARSVSASYPEKVSVWFGKGENPEVYECVIPATSLEGSEWQSLSDNFRVPADGNYRIGIKAESDAYMMQLQVDDISISENGNVNTPAGATNIKITPASKGELKATVTFNAPAVTIDGTELEMLEKVVLYNGERVVDELPAAPGQSCYMVDREPSNGVNTYTVRAYNENGGGMTVSAEAYIGFDVPLAPDDVHVTLNDDHSTITWIAPGEAGENGGYVDPAALTYTLYVVTAEGYVQLVKDGISGTSFDDYSRDSAGAQEMISYCVTACNPGGEGERAFSDDIIIVGAPYSVPFFESFARGEFNYPLWWGTRTGDSGFVKDVGSEDRDGGSVAWIPGNFGEECWLSSGKISLRGTVRPVLSFSCKAAAGTDVTMAVEAAGNGKEPEILKTVDFATGDGNWQRVMVDLSSMKDEKFIVLKFHGTANTVDRRVSVDRIRINDIVDVNLSAEIEAKGQALRGENVTYRVKVLNFGEKSADNYDVILYADGKKVAEATGSLIEPADERWLELSFPAPLEGTGMDVYAEVIADGDNNADDNKSGSVHTILVDTDLPAVTHLTGSVSGHGVVLEWDTPAVAADARTDGFEDYDAWSTDRFGRWTTYNGNDGLTVAMEGVHFPLGGHAFAYTLFNPYDLGFDPEYVPQLAPYDGKQFAGAMAEYQFDSNDKWLISPRLSGKQQTVTFHASALSEFYIESFRVLYSESGNSVDDFKEVVLTDDNVTAQWKEYEVLLPEGAKYFAIHCNSTGGFGFFIDDVTYVPGYELTGYNIYRDGECIAYVTSRENRFIDAKNVSGKYSVTACYMEGESALSDIFDSSSLVGIDNVSGSYGVAGYDGVIVLSSMSGQHVRIVDVSGMVVVNEPLYGDCRFELPQGVYIVIVGSNVHRVLVR